MPAVRSPADRAAGAQASQLCETLGITVREHVAFSARHDAQVTAIAEWAYV